MPLTSLLLLLFLIVAAALHLASILIVGGRALRAKPTASAPPDAPGVTIVRPVCGVENHIEETLGSGFLLSYPNYELVFCVASSNDPIVPVVQRLIDTFPEVPARLLIGDDRISINPKLNNVVKGWEAARHDWIIMADSNVLLPTDYVERLMEGWVEGTGMVCSPPLAIAPDGLWSELECAFLNTFQARWQLAADATGIGFAQGKTMLWRRDILEDAGGIRALAAEPAEDAAGTKIVRARGLRVRLVPCPFPQPLGPRKLTEVWRRQLRWGRLRRVSFKLFFVPESMAGGFFPMLANAALVAAGTLPLAGGLGIGAAWYGAEAALAFALGWQLSLRSPLLWMLRDAMLLFLWIGAWTGSGFVWRGNAMNMRHSSLAGADLEPLARADLKLAED
jgi:ceramide glucosyltransferase